MSQSNISNMTNDQSSITYGMDSLQVSEENISYKSEYNEEDLYDEPEDLTNQTPIQNRYSFWYMRRSKEKLSDNSYEKNIKHLGSFQTVEQFWRIYNHIVRPDDLTVVTDYHLFKDGISPTWEDPANARGGKWMVRLRKGLAGRFWEELVLAIIGEQFDVGSEICGAVMSARFAEDIISLWNRNADNLEATAKIRDTMRRVFRLPNFVQLEYKRHQESLTDNTSYRNTTVWRPERERSGGRGSGPVGGWPSQLHRQGSGSYPGTGGEWDALQSRAPYDPMGYHGGGGSGGYHRSHSQSVGGGPNSSGGGGSGGRGYFERSYSGGPGPLGFGGSRRQPYSGGQERDWSKLRRSGSHTDIGSDQNESNTGSFYDRVGGREPAWTGRNNPFHSDGP